MTDHGKSGSGREFSKAEECLSPEKSAIGDEVRCGTKSGIHDRPTLILTAKCPLARPATCVPNSQRDADI
jgi:hypothetical protein